MAERPLRISEWPFCFGRIPFRFNGVEGSWDRFQLFLRQCRSFWYPFAVMRLRSPRKFAFISLLCCVISASAQSFVFKTIHFNGDSEHTDSELSAAAGLQTGVPITVAELNDHTKQLLDSGLFEDIRFAYNENDLVIQVTPAAKLYPWRLENFPVDFGKNLDNRIHARFPLYRNKVPADGTLLNGITEELQQELAAMKINAAVSPMLYTDPNLGKITAMSFSIIDPPIQVGEIKLGVLSATMAGRAKMIAAKATGSPYKTEGSASQLETELTDFYGGQGYVEAKVHVSVLPSPVIDKSGVHIPFTVSIDEGIQYKLADAKLAPNSILSQTAFDKLLSQQPGDVIDLAKLRKSCEFLTRQYHNRGFMKAQIVLTPTFDRAHGTVSYLLTPEPGPVYTMGNLNIQNVSDDLRDMIAGAVNLRQGAVFNEGALLSMNTTHGVNPALDRVLASEKFFYTLSFHDKEYTVDVDLTAQRIN
jgi:outer membrane protein insertion porin family